MAGRDETMHGLLVRASGKALRAMTETAPQAPSVSAAKVAYHGKQFAKMFARSNDIEFLQLVWATDALQSGRAEAAADFITFPPQAAISAIDGPLAIRRWELETLTIQLFLTPKQAVHAGPNLNLDCSKFVAIWETVKRLRSLENVEAGIYLAREAFNVLSEMHRIGQRTFHWQLGYFNLAQFYRYLFVYGQGQCAEYFARQYGLTPSDFALTSLAYFASYQRRPWVRRTVVPEIGLTDAIVDSALPMLAMSLADARARSADDVALRNEQHGSSIPTAYLPSVLRRWPLIFQQTDPNRFLSPIPEVILMRATSGLYFDLIGGGQPLLNEANDRFEQYCANYIATMMPRFNVNRAFRYGPPGARVDTPDLLVKDEDQIVLLAECKATKLTYLAQFAEDPFEAQKKQYQQIAKGIFQLWRSYSHIRRGVIDLTLAPTTYAMVITLDPFAMMDRALRASIFQEASNLADQEGDIIGEDRRHVIICPISELEVVLQTSNEDILLASLQAAQREQYVGWQLREIHRDTEGARQFGPARAFPFDLGELLPWWGALQQVGIPTDHN